MSKHLLGPHHLHCRVLVVGPEQWLVLLYWMMLVQ